MRKTGKIVMILVTVLLLVFTAACAPVVTEEKEVVVTEEGVVVTVVTEEEVVVIYEEEVVTEEEVVAPTPTVEWGILEIRVTDPPPADVKSAFVHLTNLEVLKVSGNTSGWIPIIGAPPSFDLMDVIGVEAVLGSANVTAGSFTQIRMDVTEVVGETIDNVPYTANVTSGKLRIVRPFNVGAGKRTILTLDFDGEKSLIRTGSGKFLFKPVVKLLIEKEEEQKEKD